MSAIFYVKKGYLQLNCVVFRIFFNGLVEVSEIYPGSRSQSLECQ